LNALRGDMLARLKQRRQAETVSASPESDTSEIAQQLSTFKNMLDVMPVNVILADPNDNFNIIYMNETARRTLTSIEHLLPCKVADLMGQSVDIFHKNPEHQRRILADPTNLPFNTQITLGEEVMNLKVNAIVDQNGTYIGPVLVWSIVTKQMKMVNTVKEVVESVASSALEMEQSSTAMAESADKSSQLSAAVASASEEATASVQSVASAAEELSSSIGEISRQVDESSRIAREAVDEAHKTNKTVQGLSEASQKIGEIGRAHV